MKLHVAPFTSAEPTGGGTWELLSDDQPVDLTFLRNLPPESIHSLSIQSAVETSFEAVSWLADGLRMLYLGWTGFSDAVLPTVAGLTGLTYLQTFGNNFSDAGVQQLATLANLERLYLEEETLTLAAFEFVDGLPQLTRLGTQDVQLSDSERAELCRRLPRIAVD